MNFNLYTLLLTPFLVIACASAPEATNSRQPQEDKGQYEISEEKGAYEQIDKKDPPPTVVKSDKEDYNDPLEYIINRPFNYFNHYLYSYLLTPLAEGYIYITPISVDQSLGQFFSNIREPLYSANFLLQGEFSKSAQSLLRLVVNSTIGVFGFFDVAEDWFGIEDRRTTLNETLASYGVDYGVYIVLPVLGPSHLRDTLSVGAGYYYHPLNLVEDPITQRALFFVEGFQEEAPRLKAYPKVVEDSPDRYEMIRNFYLQNQMRDAKILRDKRFKKVVEE